MRRFCWLIIGGIGISTASSAAIVGIPDDQLSPPARNAPAPVKPEDSLSRPVEPVTKPFEPVPGTSFPHPDSDPAPIASPMTALTNPASKRIFRQAAKPVPELSLDPSNATAMEFITAAQASIKAGRLQAAIELIEQAQTRLLDRSVALFRTSDPINDPVILSLAQAKQALAAHDYKTGVELLDKAITANIVNRKEDQN
jgi:hypothetical protein